MLLGTYLNSIPSNCYDCCYAVDCDDDVWLWIYTSISW